MPTWMEPGPDGPAPAEYEAKAAPPLADVVEALRRQVFRLTRKVEALEARLAPPAVVVHGYDGREPEVLAGDDLRAEAEEDYRKGLVDERPDQLWNGRWTEEAQAPAQAVAERVLADLAAEVDHPWREGAGGELLIPLVGRDAKLVGLEALGEPIAWRWPNHGPTTEGPTQ